MEEFKIIKVKEDKRDEVNDLLAEEIPFTILLDDKEFVTLLCTPADLKELAYGFLFTSGVITEKEDIKKIIINEQQWTAYIELKNANPAEELVFKRLYTSGCGKGTIFYNAVDVMHRGKNTSDFKIKSSNIKNLMVEFQKKSQIYVKTGGVHSAAIADQDDILIFKEDIGRHNAIDKVIGGLICQEISFADKCLLSSGRISSEVLLKAQKCQIPVVISQSAPTNQAVKLARDLSITMIGFARGSRMNIYSNQERIT